MSVSAQSSRPALEISAPAKVNLWLEVLGKRPDGFHELRTIMQTVSLADTLRFHRRDDGEIRLSCDAPDMPPPEENLVVRAARLLRERSDCTAGVDIELKKRIPMGAGLGGGSSDCGHTLRALNQLWGLNWDAERLCEAAAELGSDVPFFLSGGTALCEGRGEKVTSLEVNNVFDYVLILPDVSVATAEVYAAVKPALTNSKSRINICTGRRALETGDAHLLGSVLRNDLQGPAFQICSKVKQTAETVQTVMPQPGCYGFGLSGSGAAFFAVCAGPEDADRLAAMLAGKGLAARSVRSADSD